MERKRSFDVILTWALLLSIVLSFVSRADGGVGVGRFGYSSSLSPFEQLVVSSINGSRAYDYDLELEKIAYENYAFRSGGSPGANETAHWIRDQFASFGLDASLEGFQFTSWNVLSKPPLVIDDDGNLSTTSDQVSVASFQSAHLSLPTGADGFFADLAILPLPPAANRSEVGTTPINLTDWNAVDITNKIVLIGKEVTLSLSWKEPFLTKLSQQPPRAIIYTWWYDWMKFSPVLQGSAEGRWYACPVGFVKYEDGLWIRNWERASNVSARFSVNAVFGTETHYNVVGKITGFENPEKTVIVSAHYDTVMTSGFVDNGAGIAGVLEIAKAIASAVQAGVYKPKYTILFVALADEELGLVGSINYVRMHKSEMPNTIAVINLDCIGSDDLEISVTNSVGEFDLDQTLLKAAQDLGVPVLLAPGGSSDHETFRDPSWADYLYSSWWGLNSGIADAVPVESSSMVSSLPLFYYDSWNYGTPGWIHTSYDNSTSTQTLNWLEVDDLENQIKTVTLALVRVSPNVRQIGAPVASFTFSPNAPLVDSSVVFNASASYDEDGTIIQYSWDFGDGTKVNETDPFSSHAYGVAGSYNVTLTVTDNEGQTITTSAMVTVHSIVHDIAVATVTPSPMEVTVGINVTVNVIVKNEGNTAETFNVVAFYNDFEIGTEHVSDLAPSSTISLNFIWNTTGVSYGEYAIKAVAIPVPGETDQVDNTFTASNRVKIKSSTQPPPQQPPTPPQLPPSTPPQTTVQLPLFPMGIFAAVIIIVLIIVVAALYLHSREQEPQKP